MARSKSKRPLQLRNILNRIFVWIVIFTLISNVFSFLSDSTDSLFPDKSHKCTADHIEATIAADSTLHVVESRTYEFKGEYTLSAIQLDPPYYGSVAVNAVSVIDEAGRESALKEVAFDEEWRYRGGPPSGCWSYDEDQETIYAFSTTEDASKTFVFDYSYSGVVEQYADANQLYWQFIPAGWDTDTQNATATLTLPVPEGEQVVGGDNVRAFGHGSLEGNVTFNDDGTISFSVPRVRSGEFAEMRVLFPTSWLTDVPSMSKWYSDIIPDALAEEEQWQQEAATQRLVNTLIIVIPALLSVAMIAVALVLFFKFGREHTPRFQDEYWRDVPDKNVHPAVIARLWRWDDEDANDLTATLMRLCAKGVIGIEPCERTKQGLLRDKTEQSYKLFVRDAALLEKMSEIDKRAYKLVFEKVGKNKQEVTLDDIGEYGKDEPEDFLHELEMWQNAVSRRVVSNGYFEQKGATIKSWFIGIAVGVMALSFGFSLSFENFMPMICLVPGSAVMFGIAFGMPRRSQEGADLYARCEALKRWFKDFTSLDESVPTDTKVWGELFVYAYIFGVAKQVAEDLNTVAPEIWNDTDFVYVSPWYYASFHHLGAASAASANDFFGDVFANTASSASSIVAANSSSGSGGGGSFGGGGGFSGGGGGGGFSR